MPIGQGEIIFEDGAKFHGTFQGFDQRKGIL